MRKLLWIAFQILIVASITMLADDYAASENRHTSPRDVAIMFFFGICLAALATGVLSKLFELVSRLLRRLVGQQRTSQDGGLVIPSRGEFLNPPNTLRAGQKQLRKPL